MLGWIKDEESVIERGVVNYKLPKYTSQKEHAAKNLNFIQLKDFLHIFVDLDDDCSNTIELSEVMTHFASVMSYRDIVELFAERDDAGMIMRDSNGRPLKMK